MAAQASIPYCVAVALVYSRAGLAEFTLENLTHPKIIELVKKVNVTIDPTLDKIWKENPQSPWSSEVEVLLQSGKRFSKKVEYPSGEPQNPISREELEQKYDSMASLALSAQKKDLLKKRMSELESVRDMKSFYQDFL